VTWFLYAARRGHGPDHGVVIEHVPWSDGKRPIPLAMMCCLACWARRRSWRETARAFPPSWEGVYRSGEWLGPWGLAHRKLEGVEAIGVDEIHWGKRKRADDFLTVIDPIDRHCRRLLWVGKGRPKATLRRGLATLGEPVVRGLRLVCPDRWRPDLTVIAAKAGQALPGLDRLHSPSPLNQAVDEVRRAESGRRRGRPVAEKLKKMRWKLWRRGSRGARPGQTQMLRPALRPAGHGAGLDAPGNFPGFLALPRSLLGQGLLGGMDHSRPAPSSGA
jgi:transposase